MRAAAWIALFLTSCGPAPTTVLLRFSLTAGTPPLDELRIDVFDPSHALKENFSIASPRLPSSILIELPPVSQGVRVALDGLSGGAVVAEAAVELPVVAHTHGAASAILSADTPDMDGDGIPDEIDNCPSAPNADQESVGGGAMGDACRDPCALAMADPTATPVACVIGNPPSIDGNLDDWPEALFQGNQITHSTAGLSGGTWSGIPSQDDANSSASFALRWDQQYLYFAVRIFDDVRGLPSTVADWQDDACEIYLGGADDFATSYGTFDHQMVIEADGERQEYKNRVLFAGGALPAGTVTAVGPGDGVAADWTLEVGVPWSAIGGSAVVGRKISFDVGIDDNDTPTTPGDTHVLVWRMKSMMCPACNGSCAPSCAPSVFGEIQLAGR